VKDGVHVRVEPMTSLGGIEKPGKDGRIFKKIAFF